MVVLQITDGMFFHVKNEYAIFVTKLINLRTNLLISQSKIIFHIL
jgi:hypothetical protein